MFQVLSGFLLMQTILTSAMARPRVIDRDLPIGRFTLPDNATSIRENIDTTFRCTDRSYGYYADTENDCQLFHVCLPVVLPKQRVEMFMWSFICPQETMFNQERFTCARPEDSIPCHESFRFYNLNDKFGQPEMEDRPAQDSNATDNTNDEENSLESATVAASR
ncbi:uncharacterized protein [Rhodnius prolixus]|uniref:Putative chitin binding peritrophin-a domain protein n=2 Tax=Rhodnius TaxID=13248 RepID=R4G8U0_RHOPR